MKWRFKFGACHDAGTNINDNGGKKIHDDQEEDGKRQSIVMCAFFLSDFLFVFYLSHSPVT